MSNQVQNFLFFFFEEDCFWTLPFSVFYLVFFLIASSLFLVCSMFWGFLSGSWNYFSWFSFCLSSFRVSSKNCRCFWTKNFKKYHWFLSEKLLLEKTLVFVILTIFCFWFVFFHAWSSFFSFFCLFLANILFLCVLISVFLFKKKKHRKTNWSSLFLCLLSLFLLFLSCSLSSFFFSLFSRCLLSFFVSSCFLFSCSITLLMFICSLWCFFCLCVLFFTLFIPFKKPFFSNSFESSFFFWFFNLVLSNKDFFFWESFLDHCSIWEKKEIFWKKKTEDFELLTKSFFLFYLQKNATEIAGATNKIVQISFVVTSTCFEQVSRCQAFSEKFKKIISFLCFFFFF